MAFFQSHWLCCSIWGSDLWFLLEEGSVEYVSRRLVWQPRWSMRDCSRKEICGWWTTEVKLAPKQVFLPNPPSSSHFFELHKFYSMGPWYSCQLWCLKGNVLRQGQQFQCTRDTTGYGGSTDIEFRILEALRC